MSGNNADIALASMLFNVWCYYKQFLPSHATRLDELRTPLAEKLQTHVKTTRWDDRSYARLRQSTKKAHSVLASLARKWQSCLGTPAATLFDVSKLVAQPRALLQTADVEWKMSAYVPQKAARVASINVGETPVRDVVLSTADDESALARLLDGSLSKRLLQVLEPHDDNDVQHVASSLTARSLSAAQRTSQWHAGLLTRTTLALDDASLSHTLWHQLDDARERLMATVNTLQQSASANTQQKRLSLVSFLRLLKTSGLSPHAAKYN